LNSIPTLAPSRLCFQLPDWRKNSGAPLSERLDIAELGRLESARRRLLERSKHRRRVIETLEAVGPALKPADAALLYRYREAESEVGVEAAKLEWQIRQLQRSAQRSAEPSPPAEMIEETLERFDGLSQQLLRRVKRRRKHVN
jgi:hypothetical protein